MAIAEKTILDPEASKPGVPLKKSTLAVIVLLLLALGFVSSLFFSSGTARAPQTPGPVLKDTAELKRTGTDQALRDEAAEAARKSRAGGGAPAAPPPAHAASSATAQPPVPPVPPGVRRENNTSALFDQGGATRVRGQAGSHGDLEFEAQTRMAKALVVDSDPPHAEQPAAPGARNALNRLISADNSAAHGAAQAPSAGVRDQIDSLRKQLQAQGTAQAAGSSKEDWLREYAKESGSRSAVNKGYRAPTRLVLREGKVIPAVLGRQINSDLPGRITAYVSSNVYDDDGRLLIPMGASLIGKYDSGVRVGQTRLMFAFQRLVLPNGYSFDLPAAAGSDLSGAAGMSGDVDNHFFKMFGTSLLIALLGDRTQQPQNVTTLGSSGPVTAAGQVLSDVSKTVLERNRVIAPTITVDQGTRINVEVVSDMVFPEQYSAR